MVEGTLQQLINQIPSAFIPANSVGIDADIQLHLLGEKSGDWVLGIHNQHCTFVEGRTTSPRLTIQTQYDDFMDLIAGRLDVTRAYMTGKLHLQGDISFAMGLKKLFRKE